MMTAISLSFVFAMIWEIIIRFTIVGGGLALIMSYIYWAACRFEDNLLKFMLVVIAPILFMAIASGVATEYGLFK